MAQKLLKCGAEVNVFDLNGASAVLLAAKGWSNTMVLLLLSSGGGIDATNEEGRTALMQTVLQDDIDAARLLLRQGAGVDFSDKDCWQQFHLDTTIW